jgi:hypothetical protein
MKTGTWGVHHETVQEQGFLDYWAKWQPHTAQQSRSFLQYENKFRNNKIFQKLVMFNG